MVFLFARPFHLRFSHKQTMVCNKSTRREKKSNTEATQSKISLLILALLSVLAWCSNRHHHTICTFKSIIVVYIYEKPPTVLKGEKKMRKRYILCACKEMNGFFFEPGHNSSAHSFVNREKVRFYFAYVQKVCQWNVRK